MMKRGREWIHTQTCHPSSFCQLWPCLSWRSIFERDYSILPYPSVLDPPCWSVQSITFHSLFFSFSSDQQILPSLINLDHFSDGRLITWRDREEKRDSCEERGEDWFIGPSYPRSFLSTSDSTQKRETERRGYDLPRRISLRSLLDIYPLTRERIQMKH